MTKEQLIKEHPELCKGIAMGYLDQRLTDVTKPCTRDEDWESYKASLVRKPLFVTEDGKQVFEGHQYWFMNEHFRIYTGIGKDGYFQGGGDFKYFSTLEAAQDYVCHKKSVFNIDEINDFYMEWSNQKSNILQFIDYLYLKVKQQLKN